MKSTKRVTFTILSLLFALNIWAEGNDSIVRVLLENKKFRIDLLDVIQEAKSPVQIYSSYSIRVDNDKINASFPYFYRNDKPTSQFKDEIVFKANKIEQIDIKEKPKQKRFIVDMTLSKDKKTYTLNAEIHYDGYCEVKLTDNKKRTVMYDGRLKLKK